MTAEQTSWLSTLVGPIRINMGHVPDPKWIGAILTSRRLKQNFRFLRRSNSRGATVGKATDDDNDNAVLMIILLPPRV